MRILTVILFATLAATSASAGSLLKVYKSPTCGCCTDWVTHMQEKGFETEVNETENLFPIKTMAQIPAGKGSCHTGFIDGYVVEGHVPAEEVERLLEERPEAIGLTVPGMPVGSPGMEMGDRRDPYEVLLIHNDGSTSVWSRHNQ